MGSLLFIAPARTSDAILATGALEQAIDEAGGPVHIACGADAVELFRAAPGSPSLHIVPARLGLADALQLLDAVGARVDLLVDTRGEAFTLAIGARRRLARPRPPALCHRVVLYSRMMRARGLLAPRVWLDRAAERAGQDAAPGEGPLLILTPAAENDAAWPGERYAAAARRIASGSGPLAGARIAIVAPASRAPAARAIVQSLDADGIEAIDLAGQLDLLGAAALMARATMVLGEDSPYLHLAAAAGAPTLGLYGPSDERVCGPFGVRARAIRGRVYEETMALREPRVRALLMDDVSVDAAEAAAVEMLSAGGFV